jgi:NADPH-dependent 2,4-dienoyl-CoA reductase/sulfur reductase-like enzyme
MKTVIVGGVAAGASTGARLRRLDESAEIVVLERGQYVSFANCGLPYHICGAIPERESLLLQTPESLGKSLALAGLIASRRLALTGVAQPLKQL